MIVVFDLFNNDWNNNAFVTPQAKSADLACGLS